MKFNQTQAAVISEKSYQDVRNSLALSFGSPISEDLVRISQDLAEDDGKLESKFALSKPSIKSKNPRLGTVKNPIIVSRFLTKQIDDCFSARQSKGLSEI